MHEHGDWSATQDLGDLNDKERWSQNILEEQLVYLKKGLTGNKLTMALQLPKSLRVLSRTQLQIGTGSVLSTKSATGSEKLTQEN